MNKAPNMSGDSSKADQGFLAVKDSPPPPAYDPEAQRDEAVAFFKEYGFVVLIKRRDLGQKLGKILQIWRQ